jgi:hypothetical protein
MNKISKLFKWAVPVLVGLFLVIGFAATPGGHWAAEVFKLFVHRGANASTEAPVTPEYSALSVNELETQLGFDIKEPTVLPDLFSFQGIRVYGKSVDFVYQCSCGGRGLDISLQPLSDATSVEVGVDTPIEEVQIGTMRGEYVEGSFVVYPGAKVATWNSEAPMRKLRWVDGEILFQMTSMGGSEEHAGYVSKAEMIAIAEGLK